MNKVETINSRAIECFKWVSLAILSGFIIHGQFVFDKISWHDDVAYINGWNSIEGIMHGRWGWALLTNIIQKMIGFDNVPMINALWAFGLIGLTMFSIYYKFGINSVKERIVLLIIALSNVAVLGNFGYFASARVNFLGIVICVIGGLVLSISFIKWKYRIVLSSILFCFALGVYQCYFALFLTVVLLGVLQSILKHEEMEWQEFFETALFDFLSSVLGLMLYVVITKVISAWYNIELTSYAGTNTFGIVNLKEYLIRCKIAYSEFLFLSFDNRYTLFPFSNRLWGYGVILSFFLLSIIAVVLAIRDKKHRKALQIMMIMLVFPLAFNINFVVYGKASVHSLHTFHVITIFIYMFILLKYIMDHSIKIGKISFACTYILIFMVGFLLVRYDNVCYMCMQMTHEKAVLTVNRIIAEVEATEGYKKGMQVAIVGDAVFGEYGENTIPISDTIVTNPYRNSMLGYTRNSLINMYIDKDFLLTTLETDQIEKYNVEQMECFPSNGSIKIVDDIVIIRFE